MVTVIYGVLVAVSLSTTLGAPSDYKISEEVAVVTDVPLAVDITTWEISLWTDLPNNRLKINATCTIRNNGEAPVDSLAFDLLGAEKFYGVEVEIAKVARLVDGKQVDVPFKRFMEQEPKDPCHARTFEYPEVTRVSLSPVLKKGGECQLVFDYTITCVDIKNEDLHYKLICEPQKGMKEACLIADFAWFPRLVADLEKWSALVVKNFFPRWSKSAWRVTLTHPVGLEGMVIDGKPEKSEREGELIVTRWKSIAGGTPQVFVGPAERVERKGDGVTVIFLLPRGKYDREYVDAIGDLLIHAHRVYTDWFGPMETNEIHIVATSGIGGGHGAFMGMTIEAPYFQKKKTGNITESGKFFAEMPTHELAHAWWADSVSSYGRGTKFLRESLANFSAWHLAREHYGMDTFSSARRKHIFRYGLGGKPLFNADSDEERFAYQKGPLVLDILRQEMGDEVFFRTLKEYARKYRNSHATFIDFVSVCNDVSQRDWMPFFYQWCYGQGCPDYQLAGFESKQAAQGWATTVRIRNDGTGIVRCLLELRMDGAIREEVFWVDGGQDKTFIYRTDKEVTDVVIDPKKTAYQAQDQLKDEKIEESQMTDQETSAINEFRQIKAGIEKGQRFEDASTPLHAVLSYGSAAEGLERDYFMALDVLRAPLPADPLKDASLCPVYMKYAGGTKLADTFILAFSKGKWIWLGNMGGRHDWRTIRQELEEAARKKTADQ